MLAWLRDAEAEGVVALEGVEAACIQLPQLARHACMQSRCQQDTETGLSFSARISTYVGNGLNFRTRTTQILRLLLNLGTRRLKFETSIPHKHTNTQTQIHTTHTPGYCPSPSALATAASRPPFTTSSRPPFRMTWVPTGWRVSHGCESNKCAVAGSCRALALISAPPYRTGLQTARTTHITRASSALKRSTAMRNSGLQTWW
eukprot:409152-Rhodomonas_salina.1